MSGSEQYEREFERLTGEMDDMIHQLRAFWEAKDNPVAPRMTAKITSMQQKLQELLDEFNETSSM